MIELDDVYSGTQQVLNVYVAIIKHIEVLFIDYPDAHQLLRTSV